MIFPISTAEIAQIVGGKIIAGPGNSAASGISTDSRSIRDGDLFVAIKGGKFNGHDFIASALKQKAAGAIVSHQELVKNVNLLPHITKDFAGRTIIAVEDTVKALGDIARTIRSASRATFVAVSGSNGKTTTKEMLFHILSEHRKVVCSEASFNNEIGVPLTMFRLRPHHEIAVFEVGTNASGELAYLASILRPHIALVTNVSETHLEGLSSVAGVAEEESTLLRTMAHEGNVILNADCPWMQYLESAARHPTVKFGLKDTAHVRGFDITTSREGLRFRVDVSGFQVTKRTSKRLPTNLRADGHLTRLRCGPAENGEFFLPIHGIWNVHNALAAITASLLLDLDLTSCADRLKSFKLPKMRMQHINAGGILFINDAYNANPASMAAAVDYLNSLQSRGKRLLVCGDMCELGPDSRQFHEELGRKVAMSQIDTMIGIGEEIAAAIDHARKNKITHHFKSREDAFPLLKQLLSPGDVILFKASRKIALDLLVDKLLIEFPAS